MKKDMCLVVRCHKCGHLLYLTIDDTIFDKIRKIEKTDCPNCGEEGFDNWFLKGIDDWNKRKIY